MNISQADCRAIFDAVSDAILIHDAATGEILEVNRGMCEMFGYTPEEARQLKVTALCGGEAGSQLEPALSLLAKAAAGSPQVFEWQARDRAGRVFWVEVHLKPIRLGGRDRVLAVLRDIDQRKRAEEALQGERGPLPRGHGRVFGRGVRHPGRGLRLCESHHGPDFWLPA